MNERIGAYLDCKAGEKPFRRRSSLARIPIGKLKGIRAHQIAEADPWYARWLCAQEWLPAKCPQLYEELLAYVARDLGAEVAKFRGEWWSKMGLTAAERGKLMSAEQPQEYVEAVTPVVEALVDAVQLLAGRARLPGAEREYQLVVEILELIKRRDERFVDSDI